MLTTPSDLRSLDDTTLRAWFDTAREELNYRISRKVVLAGNQFRVGDLVSFRAKSGARIIMMVAKVNTKTMSGVEVDPITRVANKFKSWRVTPTLVQRFSWPTAASAVVPSPSTARTPVGVGAGSY